MKIINLSKRSKGNNEVIIALGNFDGVHRGHQELIHSVIELSDLTSYTPSVLMFNNHTKSEINLAPPKTITSNNQKINIFKDMGIEKVFSFNFNKEIMNLSPEEFVSKLLIEKLNVKGIVVGFDYRFGYKAKGDIEELKRLSDKYDLYLKVVEPVNFANIIISSTEIRKLIKDNNFRLSRELLGRPFTIEGKVVGGSKRGKDLGFATANLSYEADYIFPKGGVYITVVKYDKNLYPAVTNLGYNPTFDGEEFKVETHILDFNKDIYGEYLEISFLEFIREDIYFENIDQLIKRIEKDVNYARKWINREGLDFTISNNYDKI